ncbi:hypothetical protein [Pseudanabaena sp. PCC 6802]|uniref:hypothetical protein n=1 Tax=Pseudanabaena sp. PCC 6802 TaxID=118173 RepID=UPI00034575FD|nr:hypothetical protein [Pseudanabaena sp. PCC 6802]
MLFRTLFTIAISHTYYTQGCKDFSFIIPVDSVQLLNNGKLIAKIRDGKLHVLFAVDEAAEDGADATDRTGKPLVSLAGKSLRIGLKLLNPFFSNFTQFTSSDFDNLTQIPISALDFYSFCPLYRNSANPLVLDKPKAVALVGQVLNHSLSQTTARPITVTLKNSDGQVLPPELTDAPGTIATENNRSSVSFNLTGKASGLYSVEESSSSGTQTTSYYSDLELQQQGIFGAIEIAIADSLYTKPPDQPPEFTIAFKAREETLKYYILAQNYSDSQFNQLTVSDAGEEGRSQINFTKVLPAAFTEGDIPPGLLGNGDVKIALFKSQITVPRQEKARQKIQLKSNDTVLISHLPQPDVNKTNADAIVQLAKPRP